MVWGLRPHTPHKGKKHKGKRLTSLGYTEPDDVDPVRGEVPATGGRAQPPRPVEPGAAAKRAETRIIRI